ncbi:lytic transglycosylase domain-containing protein [Sulfurospirillum sp. 1612]|uniref:lytic transglycosylase domain-containing protein n=1 Tax=Sulfurospirillum sp. 1612 TaxID=3094835 RepID=UPI002F95365D
MYRLLGICIAIPVLLFAKVPADVAAFETLPKSISKDYYIYRFLNENNVSSSDAQRLLEEAKVVNLKLFRSFAKRIDDPGFKKVAACLRYKTDTLLQKDNECIAIGLSVWDAMHLKKEKIKQLAHKLSAYKETHTILKILASEDVFKAALRDKKAFIKIFTSCGAKNRSKIFNRTLTPKELEALSQEKGFNSVIERIMTQRNLKKLQTSLLELPTHAHLNANAIFFLGLNALEHHKKELARTLFAEASQKYYYRFDKDKTLFWRYLATHESSYLDALMKSFDVNIYTIFAHEIRGKKFDNIKSPHIDADAKDYDIKNPFLWVNLLQEIKDKNATQLDHIAQQYKHKNTIGQYAFIKERAFGDKYNYFPMPFYQYLEQYDHHRIALILSIARQESRFIPASISTSYALGMMQFMPFLARATAKEQALKDFDIDAMFQPKIAYQFANHHLDYLSKHLSNPLFIAYAYNGGIGFVRRMLKTGNYFTKGAYEPYMSMELIPYAESRRYGKKVLANYIIYSQLLGEKITLQDSSHTFMAPNIKGSK